MNPFQKEDKMIRLKTRSKGKPFWYERTPDNKIRIIFGQDRKTAIPVQKYESMIRAFRGKEVELRPTRGIPKAGSVEAWVRLNNITKTAIASYLGPILVHEERAEWLDDAPVLTVRFCGD